MVERVGQWPTGRMLSAVARRVERDWNAHLARWELNHASLPVLYLLAAGPRSQRELAASSGVTEQTMSRIVGRLDRCGYVARLPHPDDRRRHHVELTPTGRRALQEAGDPRVAEEMSVRGLSSGEVAQLRGLLGRMLAARPAVTDPADGTFEVGGAASTEDVEATTPPTTPPTTRGDPPTTSG